MREGFQTPISFVYEQAAVYCGGTLEERKKEYCNMGIIGSGYSE